MMQNIFNYLVNNDLSGDYQRTGGLLSPGAMRRKWDVLWRFNPDIHSILRDADDLEGARKGLLEYLNLREANILNDTERYHILEKSTILEAITVFKVIISRSAERETGISNLRMLYKLSRGEEVELSEGFILEYVHLFKAIDGKAEVYSHSKVLDEGADFHQKRGREAAVQRSRTLDREVRQIDDFLSRYPSGMEPEVIEDRRRHKGRILRYFGATDDDWNNYHWQLKHVIRKADVLKEIINLTEEEERSIRLANQNRIPFGITPYYVSLMDKNSSRKRDHAVRAQVIPPLHYTQTVAENRESRSEMFDFMGEYDTSPIPLVTRRYPQIAILKPYNTCAQICVYCQRNWEINQVLDPHAFARSETVATALQWFEEHPAIQEVLITGGDPLVMSDAKIHTLLERFAAIEHIQRIRIGTRMPVVLPQRFTDDLVNILTKYHEFGKREVAVVTHFEHVWEITPAAVEAIKKIRDRGIGIYNQAVFTFENSRRFELAALRRQLRLAGVDPYYTFNAKGKEETRAYRVPIARLLQERKEEARLLPGLDRTDEPVFNVPRLGKNHLRAGQDHQLLAILPDGRRLYRFLPWEKNIKLVPTYVHRDVSIYDYLKMLHKRGEDIADYQTIWYYY
ncbi:MAG: KamA family radical SAM protein [Fidelibacterota bacterium]